MKIKVCHFSDWHGMWLPLEWADLYICTGDMNPNSMGHKTNWAYEEKFQYKFMRDNPLHDHLLNRDADVICVRGNHEHAYISTLFPGHRIMEIKKPEEVFIWNGLKVGGMTGVKYIRGNGPDEMKLRDLNEQAKRIPPGLDLLITHCGPFGILDKADQQIKKDETGAHTGCPELYAYIEENQPKAHFFGHIHERKGIEMVGKTICSNAATGVNIIELDIDQG